MANRQHFSRGVKFEIAKRATRSDGQMACERCGAIGVRLELHHLDMDAMKTDEAKRAKKLTATDGAMWCVQCHAPETKRQRRVLSRVEKAQLRHLGLARSKRPIPSRPFSPPPEKNRRVTKTCAGVPALARQIVEN